MENKRKFTIPSDFADCLALEKTAKEWRVWSKRIVLISRVLAAATILWGIAQGVMDSPMDGLKLLFTMVGWGLLAGVILAVFRVVSLLLQTVAGIAENVGVMTRIIVFQSAVDGYPDNRLQDHYCPDLSRL